jgi:hypothetical protein
MAQGKSPGGNGISGKHRVVAWGGVVVVTIAVAVAIVWFHDRKNPETGSRQESRAEIIVARYVGSDTCLSCHTAEAAEWRQSQHRAAMAEANGQTVLGNFNEAKFTYASVTSRFFKRDGKFYARTDGPDGKLADFQIKYTFGVHPLQQYLVEFPDGRLQALSIAWDARAAKDRGQRWFHLYPKERITHDDELHWTRAAQNWNFTCADCHSTELRKNYDPAANRFQTRWAEIHVGCEACHGPGSRHLAWAEATKTGQSAADATRGLSARLEERRDVTWVANARPAMRRARVRERPRREIEVCAQCHSRRSQIADGYKPASRSSITIDRRCSRVRSTMSMVNSATRFTTGARSCKARCTRVGSPAATATIRIAENCAPTETPFASAVISRVSTIRRSITTIIKMAPAPRVRPATCRPRLT